MHSSRTRRGFIVKSACALAPAAGIGWPGLASAQDDYPSRSIRLIVPFPPGGGGDMMFRTVATQLGPKLGQSIVVENRAGAAGEIGFRAGAQAAADGYTITGLAQPIVINPFMFKSKVVDPAKEFVPIITLYAYSLVLVAHPSLPAKTVQELVALAKGSPGTISYGSLGGTVQLALAQFASATGTKYLTVPYKGTADQSTAILGGQVMLTSLPLGVAMPQIKDGRIRPLAYFGSVRSHLLPDIPTANELYPGTTMSGWLGFAVPAGTPRRIVDRLHRATAEVLADAGVRDYVRKSGNDEFVQGPDDFARIIREDLRRFEKLTKDAGVVPE